MKIFVLILAFAGTGLGLVQHGKIRTVRAQIDSHRAALAEVQALGTPLDRAQPVPLTEAQIATLRAEKAELMQLRAGLPKLRDQARSTNEIAAEIEKLNADAARHQESARAIEVTFVEEQRSQAVQGTLAQLAAFFRLASSRRTNGEADAGAESSRLPRSTEELGTFLLQAESIPGVLSLWTNLGRAYPPFNMSRESFEFVPPAASKSGSLLLRERAPRHQPDGQWARFYLYTNTQTQQILLPEQDFSAWEAQQ
jgi:hypothetical protein